MSEIQNCDQLKAQISKAETREEQRACIARALELGCVEHIPDDWGIEVSHGRGREDGKQ